MRHRPRALRSLVALLGTLAACSDPLIGDPDLGPRPDGGGQAPLHATQADGRYLQDSSPFYQDVSGARVAADSDAITAWMVGKRPPGGFGGGAMQIDFSIVAVNVPDGTPKRVFAKVTDHFSEPDCDTASIPVPPGGAVEETNNVATQFTTPFSGYSCGGFGNGDDCHMLFVARAEKRLYEVYHATITGSGDAHAGCLAIWDTTKVDPNGRGQQCTSADAAGFPIAPLLFTAEEIRRGSIDHAIRFILPNDMIRARKYVAPATHGTNTTGPATSGPYGFRMRLKAGYPVATLSPAAQVVARALQKYGMLMSDGGQVALTAQSDVLGSVKWADVGLSASSLSALKATDFEVIDAGTPIDVTYDCKRTQITD